MGRLSLKVIGEVQYGFGIALVLLTIIGSFALYEQESTIMQEQYLEYTNNFRADFGQQQWSSKENLMIAYGGGFQPPVDLWHTRLLTIISVAIALGLFSLGFSMMLQGIANIKLYHDH